MLIKILNIRNCCCLKFATRLICENSVRNLQCLSENFKFLFHSFFQHMTPLGLSQRSLFYFSFIFLSLSLIFIFTLLFSGLFFHALKMSPEMSSSKIFFRKFDIGTGEFIGYHIMLPTDQAHDDNDRIFLMYYTVFQKNIPNIFDCNLKTNHQILIIFGTNVPDTTCHQVTVQFPTSPNVCFCTTWGKCNQRITTFIQCDMIA